MKGSRVKKLPFTKVSIIDAIKHEYESVRLQESCPLQQPYQRYLRSDSRSENSVFPAFILEQILSRHYPKGFSSRISGHSKPFANLAVRWKKRLGNAYHNSADLFSFCQLNQSVSVYGVDILCLIGIFLCKRIGIVRMFVT